MCAAMQLADRQGAVTDAGLSVFFDGVRDIVGHLNSVKRVDLDVREPRAPALDAADLYGIIPDDVRAIAHDALRHRLVLSYEASAAGVDADRVIDDIVRHVTAI